MKKKQTITNGLGWIRFLLLPFLMASINSVFTTPGSLGQSLVSTLLLVMAFYLLGRLRKIRYDDQNLYLIYGKTEKIIPFKAICELKESAARVNGSRYWLLTYSNDQGKAKTIRFFHGIFQGFTEDFHKPLRMANPSVKIIKFSRYKQFTDSLRSFKRKKSSSSDIFS